MKVEVRGWQSTQQLPTLPSSCRLQESSWLLGLMFSHDGISWDSCSVFLDSLHSVLSYRYRALKLPRPRRGSRSRNKTLRASEFLERILLPGPFKPAGDAARKRRTTKPQTTPPSKQSATAAFLQRYPPARPAPVQQWLPEKGPRDGLSCACSS